MYRVVDAVVVRAATHPVGTELPEWPELAGITSEHVQRWGEWLERVWSRESFAEAIEVASPVLAHQVGKVLDGRCRDPRRMRRILMSVTRYVLRMTDRATPFGLFAGVAPAAFGHRSTAWWGGEHRSVVRPDAEWLAATATRLETCPELLHRLPAVANNLCVIRGDRLVAPSQQHIDDPRDNVGQAAPVEVSVRRTRAVVAAMRYARSPIVVGDLAGKLAADFPRTPTAVINEMLAELVRLRLLVTSLRPPMTVTDPLRHVAGQLTAVGADTIPQVADRVRELRAMHDDLSRHNRASPQSHRQEWRAFLAGQTPRDVATADPLMVDVRLDADIVLPHIVAREAETAAAALMRLTPHPSGLPAWEDYHAAFVERYGIGAVVPLQEIVNPDTGLGFPATYRGSARKPPAPSSVRDERLTALAHKTVLDGGHEITLDEQTISHVAADDGNVGQIPPHTELFVQLHAVSLTAVERGEFRLVVTGASRAAGTTTGRFLDLFDPADRDRISKVYAGLPTLRAGALAMQVSCPPMHARSEGVARAPAALPEVISAAEHPASDDTVIPLDDLAVTGDADGLYLVSLSRQRPVEPTVLNAVEFRNFTHPLARFLCEITRARAAVYMPFSWGTASSLPFLPRIRHGRVVLAPARWNLPATDLPGKNALWRHWQDAVATWCQRLRVPPTVYLGEADNLLRLNLDEEMHLALLRSHLDRRGHASLYETPNADAYGWLDGHAHELVVPLASTMPAVKPAPSTRNARAHLVGRAYGHLPGCSAWLYAKLYSHPDRQAELLTHIPTLLAAWDRPPTWWYVRYLDPEPHLRLRFRLSSPDAFGSAARRVAAWAADLRARGLAGCLQFDTYYPETGRYGTGLAMAAAESVFAADSTAALTQIAHAATITPYPEAVTAASLVNIAVSFTGSTTDGMHWLINHVPRESASVRPSRAIHTEAMRLADPDDHPALCATAGGEEIVNAWTRRAAALATYRGALSASGDVSADSVLAALLHMHHIRVAGIDPQTEQTCHHLARSAAVRWAARAGGLQR